ncbi:hypothetical protein [uncultured Roseibium sp.]|uniref:hypothetical protein n=1 Tax=uncultured Roseibium sp. TaxID=1936171 RepID=UPI00261A5A45|nr:hypothetical protein [uncultured Roseibium sp.]
MSDDKNGPPKPEEDEQKKWLYFAIPGKGSKDPFSGQYLRLYSGIGHDEKQHIPEAVFSGKTPLPALAKETDFKSATISAKGVYVLKADQQLKETFGTALTETVRHGDHKIQVDDGDWKLISQNGAIDISTKATYPNGKITLRSGDSNIFLKAEKGSTKTSQNGEVSVSKGDYLNYILGAELSWTHGTNNNEYYGLSFKLNRYTEISAFASASISGTAVEATSFTFENNYSLFSVNMGLVNRSCYMISSERAFVFNKFCHVNISKVLNEARSAELSLSNDVTQMDTRIAEARSVALEQGWAGLKVFNA